MANLLLLGEHTMELVTNLGFNASKYANHLLIDSLVGMH